MPAEYTDRLTRVFEKHGTKGTWYAHASVGCLHVRPVLNMRADGAHKMRGLDENHFSRRKPMAVERGTGGNTGGIGLGGILVIVGIVVMLVWSFVLGLIITLVGLVAFGGFAKGKWY